MNLILFPKKTWQSEKELLQRCQEIEGFSISQLAHSLQLSIPLTQSQRKGFIGLAAELALGATAGNLCAPDFTHLGIELKTIPLNNKGKPIESTFITSIPLLTIHQQTWENSQCFAKLKKVLWLPVEGDSTIPFEHRRIGRGLLWSPTKQEETILSEDWHELSTMISTGQLEQITAKIGQFLQVRPKAAHAKSLCYGFGSDGSKILTLPRGFYLRAKFTESIIRR